MLFNVLAKIFVDGRVEASQLLKRLEEAVVELMEYLQIQCLCALIIEIVVADEMCLCPALLKEALEKLQPYSKSLHLSGLSEVAIRTYIDSGALRPSSFHVSSSIKISSEIRNSLKELGIDLVLTCDDFDCHFFEVSNLSWVIRFAAMSRDHSVLSWKAYSFG